MKNGCHKLTNKILKSKAVKIKILKMVEIDQKMRSGLKKGGKWENKIDVKNTREMKKIVKK